jgi:hypothetical protein
LRKRLRINEALENGYGVMTVKFLGENDPRYFLEGKIYTVIAKVGNLYRIIDETGEDYLYSLEYFEIVEVSEDDLCKNDLKKEKEKMQINQSVRAENDRKIYIKKSIPFKYT